MRLQLYIGGGGGGGEIDQVGVCWVKLVISGPFTPGLSSSTEQRLIECISQSCQGYKGNY